MQGKIITNIVGQWLGSVGNAFASDTRGPRFNSGHQQIFKQHLFTVNCIKNDENKEKEARKAPF